MKQSTHDVLKDHFSKLSSALHNAKTDALHHDELDWCARLSLQILSILMNDRAAVKKIGHDLAIIYNLALDVDYEQELLLAFACIDEEAEGEQQGFHALAMWALYDVGIKKNPRVMLCNIDGVDECLIGHFYDLEKTISLCVYVQKKRRIDNSILSSCLFAKSLQKLINYQYKKNSFMVYDWLKCRVKNPLLTELYCRLVTKNDDDLIYKINF